jgi:hypothetical protein
MMGVRWLGLRAGDRRNFRVLMRKILTGMRILLNLTILKIWVKMILLPISKKNKYTKHDK